jgi:vancomycin aglycone glucosyltransferase
VKILLSSVGTRGDVQPMVALALQLRVLGHDTLLSVPPNFQAWVESYGLACIPLGRDVQIFVSDAQKNFSGGSTRKAQKLLRFVYEEIATQFRVLADAARGCDVIVGGSLLTAGASIAELCKIPYVYAAYCPSILPTHELPPPDNYSHSLPQWVNRLLWIVTESVINFAWRSAVNEQRCKLGLAPINRMWRNMMTQRPLLACDALLAPATVTKDLQATQTGAWFLSDPTPLPEQVEKFLAIGDPPIYFGFGSMPVLAPEETSRMLVGAARAVGRRAIVSQGWANLGRVDSQDDYISIGAVAHEKLFPRVAAIVHHGGAGTTSMAARAGKPQVIVPHMSDQFYWAHRIEQLGIGVATGDATQLSTGELVGALRNCLQSKIALSANSVASRIELQGARIAAENIVAMVQQHPEKQQGGSL